MLVQRRASQVCSVQEGVLGWLVDVCPSALDKSVDSDFVTA